MKKMLFMIFFCLFLLVSGCSGRYSMVETDEEIRIPEDEDALGEAAAIYENETLEDEQPQGEKIISDDGVYQLIIPDGWEVCENQVNEQMLFEFQGQTEEQYIGVLILDVESFGAIDIDEFASQYAQNADIQYGEIAIDEVATVDILQRPVRMLRISGVFDDKEYINHICIMEYEEGLVVISAGAYAMNEENVKNALYMVAESFEKKG